MSNRQSDTRHPEDLPWNDVPGDSGVVPGSEEPAPAEINGDTGHEHDVASPRIRESDYAYHRDTLAERLAEEEPESRLGPAPDREVQLQGPEHGGGDVLLAEQDDREGAGRSDVPAAQDSAMHLQR